MKKNTHGGKRNGSGAKKKEPTKVIRVPVSKLEAVKTLITKRHCPRCLSHSVVMFTADLDLCNACGHTFS